ncbi:hypothetical protein PMIN01_09832 [Paraphaeosphaeria minitans]|uniref:Uncharacterized protein n=1 Tax=Paraphaeosphaeria minitans TaxID=565426 RepID=A0A9P6KLV3_9PLEO|nr:hypothetical protein PMIN01_09832 [Paraphaeosphaeria minitans]
MFGHYHGLTTLTLSHALAAHPAPWAAVAVPSMALSSPEFIRKLPSRYALRCTQHCSVHLPVVCPSTQHPTRRSSINPCDCYNSTRPSPHQSHPAESTSLHSTLSTYPSLHLAWLYDNDRARYLAAAVGTPTLLAEVNHAWWRTLVQNENNARKVDPSTQRKHYHSGTPLF